MSQILYINILVDWSLSGIMTSKLVIRESESARPAPRRFNFTNDEFLGHYPILSDHSGGLLNPNCLTYTVFDLIGARGAYVNLFSTTSVKRTSSGR